MTRRTSSLVALVLYLSLAAAGLAGAQAPPADIDRVVASAMQAFDVPGLALAIVKDGKVVYAKGYGVGRLDAPVPVTTRTLFAIASNTKAFTSAAVGILVDDGKVEWNGPLVKYLPDFRLADPYVTSQLMVRDLLSHRTGLGLGQGDLTFFPDTTFTRSEVLEAARSLKPVTSLRSAYAYNNLTFVVAGELIARVSGQPWDDFVRQRILEPVGMTSTVTTGASVPPGAALAFPHSRGWRLEGPLHSLVPTIDKTWAGAAGIRSNVEDLSKWVMLQLNQGKLPNGKTIFSVAAQRQMWSMQIARPIGAPRAGLERATPQFAGYGLGWGLSEYAGHKVVSHGGALTGMVSTVQMIPDQKLGIVVLTNQEETGAYSAIVFHVFDHYLGLAANDWVAGFRKERDEEIRRANEKEQRGVKARAAASQPSLPLERYAGTYRDAWYGDVAIDVQPGGGLVLKMTRTPTMTADLAHWQYDTFKAVFRDPTVPDAYLSFTLGPDGKITEARMVPTNDLADFSFDYQDLVLKPVPVPIPTPGSPSSVPPRLPGKVEGRPRGR
jgi:CubicO group peptidase (beta-lactamase class C family)